jgi:hypothetical protein
LLALKKALASMKDTCGDSDKFCKAQSFKFVCESKRSVAETVETVIVV